MVSSLLDRKCSMLSDRQMGILWIVLASLGYAFLPIIIRTIYTVSDLQPTDVALWRFIFATPAIWLVIYWREKNKAQKLKTRDSRSQILRMMALGVFMTGAALSGFFGLRYVPASLYIVLFYTYPAMVAIISIFLGQKLKMAAWLALVLTIVGVILTVPDIRLAGENTLLGIAIALLNAGFIAVYFVIVSRELPKVSSMSRGAAYVITGTLICLLLLIPFFGLALPDNIVIWGLLIAMATWSTAMPIFVINLGIQRIGVTQASIISTCEPILTMILAMLLLHESILPIQWIGAALIIAGVIILEIRPRQKIISV